MAFKPETIDVEDFLECLEIESVSKATSEEWQFSCPFPGHDDGDSKPSAYMNDETTAFFCHGCHAKGNAVHFTARLLGVSQVEAVRMLRQRYQPGGLNPDAVSMLEVVRKMWAEKEQEPINSPISESHIERYAVDWLDAYMAWRESGTSHPALDYMFERGFEPETLEDWEFGYCHDTERITFAVRDEFGRLLGFKGRAWQDHHKPKYLVLGDQRGGRERFLYPLYMTSHVLFGLHAAVAETAEPRALTHLILCEGELDVVALAQKGWPGAVAVNGSHFSPQHEKLLRTYADQVTLFFDSDSAGSDAVQGWTDPDTGDYHPGIIDRLKPFMDVFVVPPHEGDPASMTIEEIAETLANRQTWLQARLGLANI
jgi:DNA primase